MRPYELSLTAAADAIRERELSPVELVESVLDRIEEVEPHLGAYVTLTADRARMTAREAEQDITAGRLRGPLHGIPMGLKDLIDVAGTATTASSRVRSGHHAEADSAVAAALAAAGAVLVGKTHTHEFAYGLITPQTSNAWDRNRVARRFERRIGRRGRRRLRDLRARHRYRRIDPRTRRAQRGRRTEADLRPHPPIRRHLPVLVPGPCRPDRPHCRGRGRGPDRTGRPRPRDPASVAIPAANYRLDAGTDLRGLRIGVPRNYYFDHVAAEVEAAVRRAISELETLGAHLVEVEIPMTRYIQATQWGLMVPEATAFHEKTLRTVPERYQPDVRILLEAGELVQAGDYLRAQRARTLMRQAWARMFEQADVIATPTVPLTAVKAGDNAVTWPDGTAEGVSDAYVRLAAPANITGIPALSIPIGHDTEGMPIGMQLLGRPFGEPTVLRVGHAYERTQPARPLAMA